jgi:hypothetical protein
MHRAFHTVIDFADRIYCEVMHPIREARKRARWVLFRQSLEICSDCGAAAAQWYHVPASNQFYRCDDCIPRGCTCQIIDSSIRGETIVEPPNDDGDVFIWTDFGGIEPAQHQDERGRLLPCIDFTFDRWGWPKSHNAA